MKDIEGWTTCGKHLNPTCTSNELVDGTRKLIQRFLIAFLQEPGSVRYAFGRAGPVGARFMQALSSGNMWSEMDVFAAFGLSRPVVRAFLQAEEDHDDSDYERFKDAVLKGIELSPGQMILQILLTSRARSTTIYLPIEIP